jgi:glycogen synthase
MNKVLILSKEFPPHVYGGAGVHVEFLSAELAKMLSVEVRCFGEQHSAAATGEVEVSGFSADADVFSALDDSLRRAIEPAGIGLRMASTPTDADVVHCHTWYSMLAGVWMKKLYGVPLVVTAHSLEPLRPWKREQLGRGYDLSLWIERVAYEEADAIIAVSTATRDEVLECYRVDAERVHVIHNGIDLDVYRKCDGSSVVARYAEKYGFDPSRPFVLFVGRITRQKGVVHLVRALRCMHSDIQVVLCAGAPDTEAMGREMESEVRRVSEERPGIVWVPEMVPLDDIVALYSEAAMFVCPSVYEPFGIINLEAMACETPVVATSVGGIPEVVVHGETGLLVPFESADDSIEPRDPEAFALSLAKAIDQLAADDELCHSMGLAGRRRVEEQFSWASIARKTVDLYREVCSSVPAGA